MKSYSSRQAAPSADRFSGGLPVPAIHIDLSDGFDHDDVVLHVNNREAARGSDVTTNLTLSCCLVRRPEARRGTGSKCAISYSKDRRIQCFQTVTKPVIPPFDDWRLTSRRTENIGLKDGQILLE